MIAPYYQDDQATIYCGDCRDILPQLELRSACVLADPPYGVGKYYGEKSKDTLENFQQAVRWIVSLELPSVIHAPASRLYDVPERPQWVGVWKKTYGASGLIAYPFYPHWEALLFYHIKGNYAGNKGHRSDVFEFAPIRALTGDHPNPKPLDLTLELIRFLSVRLVVDPYAGSGTTLVAAKRLGCQAIGVEIEEQHCQEMVDRLRQEVLPFTQSQPVPTQQGLFA